MPACASFGGACPNWQQLDGARGLDGVEGLQEWQKLLGQRVGLPNISLSDLSLRGVIREPQVYFKGNGHLVVRGYGEVLGQRQPLRLVFAPRASEGEWVFDFVEGRLFLDTSLEASRNNTRVAPLQSPGAMLPASAPTGCR